MDEAKLPWPTEIRLAKDRKTLTVRFDDGADFALAAEYLRVLTPSAEARGHGAGERKTVYGKRAVTIAAVAPVGNYAVRLTFDDGHDTGLFSWTYLRELGEERERLWTEYLDALTARGLSRDT